MEIKIPRANWTRHLAEAIEDSQDGDTIVCHSAEMQELAENAKKRMCPNKTLIFTIKEPTIFGFGMGME